MRNIFIPIILSVAVLAISSFLTTTTFVATHTTASLNCKTASGWDPFNLGFRAGCAAAEYLNDILEPPFPENSKDQFVRDADTFAPNLPDVPGTPDPAQGIPELIAFIYGFAIWIVGAIVFIQITRAGVMWLLAAGDTGKIGKARSLITNAIFGLILLLSSVVILNTINPNLTLNSFELPKFTGATPGIDPSLVP